MVIYKINFNEVNKNKFEELLKKDINEFCLKYNLNTNEEYIYALKVLRDTSYIPNHLSLKHIFEIWYRG